MASRFRFPDAESARTPIRPKDNTMLSPVLFTGGRLARRSTFLRATGLAAALALPVSALPALTVDFGDVNLATPPTQAGFGGVYYNGSDLAGGWSSGGANFNNSYTDFGGGFYAWDGFSYSTANDTTTGGFTNQFSAFASSNAGAYAIAFPASTITFSEAITPQSIRLTNNTYAAFDMASGSFFSKKFGGASGNDPDWFKVTLTGRDATAAVTGAVEFYLADFRFLDSALDYLVDDWTTVDLGALGTGVKTLALTFASSDVGAFGINTPSYVALDDLVYATAIPEPATAASLFGASLLGLAMLRRLPRNTARPRA